MSTIRLDRNAFRRGVEDVMTLAPLRDVVRTASGVFIERSKVERKDDNHKTMGRELRQNDGKPTRR